MSVRRIGVLDAWRGIAVSLVITGHLFIGRFNSWVADGTFASLRSGSMRLDQIAKALIWRLSETGALLGLSIFFVISGYLITSIMVDEQARTGAVSLKRFYLRRVCRIVPALVGFLIGCILLDAAGQLTVDPQGLLYASTFTCDIVHRCGWTFGHLWSLALEEQFYLVWPVAFVLWPAHRRALARLTALVAFTSLLVIAPAYHDVASGLACIATGMLFAVEPGVRDWIVQRANGTWALVAIALFFAPVLIPQTSLLSKVLVCIAPAAACIVVVESLNATSTMRGFVDRAFFHRLGLFSYKLYLWQQIFTARFANGDFSLLRFAWLLIPVAWVSCCYIELPAIRFGRRASLETPVPIKLEERA